MQRSGDTNGGHSNNGQRQRGSNFRHGLYRVNVLIVTQTKPMPARLIDRTWSGGDRQGE